MDSSSYDVTLAVPSHGIHNPINLHSCRPHPCYVPSECAVCKYIMFPLMSSATCMRCNQSFHRECVKDIKSICSNFMKEKPSNSSIGAKEGDVLWSSEDEADGFDHLVNGTEPEWREILVALSGKFKIETIDIADKNHSKLHDIVMSLLADNSQFSGIVTSAVRTLYLKHSYKTHYAAVTAARRGLDQISSSVLCVLPPQSASDADDTKFIINLVDRYALSKNDNSMYEKVMAAATTLANKADEALFHHLNKDYSEPIDDAICGHILTDEFFKVLQATTSMDKLMALSHALRACVAEDVLARDSSQEADAAGGVPQRRKSGGKIQMAPHGADALIEKLIAVICFLTKRYKLRWHAQCTFIELMCPDTSWLFGAEGYSLVTLQQVLSSLQPPVADFELGSLSGSGHGAAAACTAVVIGGAIGVSSGGMVTSASSINIGEHLDRLMSASTDDFATE